MEVAAETLYSIPEDLKPFVTLQRHHPRALASHVTTIVKELTQRSIARNWRLRRLARSYFRKLDPAVLARVGERYIEVCEKIVNSTTGVSS